jgi:hypothetical protein
MRNLRELKCTLRTPREVTAAEAYFKKDLKRYVPKYPDLPFRG